MRLEQLRMGNKCEARWSVVETEYIQIKEGLVSWYLFI